MIGAGFVLRFTWMQGPLLSLTLLGSLWLAQPAAAHPAEAERLGRYEVTLHSEPIAPGVVRHRAAGIFDAAPEAVLRVATRYDEYREYMPRVIASRTVSRAPGEAVVLLEAEMPWPLPIAWAYTRFRSEPHQGHGELVRFSMVRGNMLRYEGSLVIEPYDRGRSLVTYELVAQPDLRLPRAWVQPLIGRGAASFLHSLRSRINHLQRHGLLAQAPHHSHEE